MHLRRAVEATARLMTLYFSGLPVIRKYCLASFTPTPPPPATGGEEHQLRGPRGQGCQTLGEFDGFGVRVRPDRGEVEGTGLIGRGHGEFPRPWPIIAVNSPDRPSK